jgi:hypothetical protein
MIIAKIRADEACELTFDIKIDGSTEEPSDIRFIIEAQTDNGVEVQDKFAIICKAVREKDAIKVYIPRLLNLFRSGSYRARLEVVLENRLFVPLTEEIMIEEAPNVSVIKKLEPVIESHKAPEVTVTLSNVIEQMLNHEPNPIKPPEKIVRHEPVREQIVIDKSWRNEGFKGIKNPFKREVK